MLPECTSTFTGKFSRLALRTSTMCVFTTPVLIASTDIVDMGRTSYGYACTCQFWPPCWIFSLRNSDHSCSEHLISNNQTRQCFTSSHINKFVPHVSGEGCWILCQLTSSASSAGPQLQALAARSQRSLPDPNSKPRIERSPPDLDHKESPKRYQIKWQKEGGTICEILWDRMPNRMSKYMSGRFSVGGDLSEMWTRCWARSNSMPSVPYTAGFLR